MKVEIFYFKKRKENKDFLTIFDAETTSARNFIEVLTRDVDRGVRIVGAAFADSDSDYMKDRV